MSREFICRYSSLSLSVVTFVKDTEYSPTTKTVLKTALLSPIPSIPTKSIATRDWKSLCTKDKKRSPVERFFIWFNAIFSLLPYNRNVVFYPLTTKKAYPRVRFLFVLISLDWELRLQEFPQREHPQREFLRQELLLRGFLNPLQSKGSFRYLRQRSA